MYPGTIAGFGTAVQGTIKAVAVSVTAAVMVPPTAVMTAHIAAASATTMVRASDRTRMLTA
jgi:hypothetical protein